MLPVVDYLGLLTLQTALFLQWLYIASIIKNDVLIVAKALKVLFNENLKKMTQGSNALHDFKEMLSKSKFEHYFPDLDYEVDKDLRKAYKRWFYLFKSNR